LRRESRSNSKRDWNIDEERAPATGAPSAFMHAGKLTPKKRMAKRL